MSTTQRSISINSTGESTALLACGSTIGLQTVYFNSGQLALQDNDIIYTVTNDASSLLVGANLYFSDGSNSFQVDNSGVITNLTSCDITPPVITITPTGTINVEVSTSTTPATYTDTGVTASDSGVDISGDIVVGGDTVDINVIGQYDLTYNVDDAAGNSAVEGTRTVNVVYTIAPVITLNGDAVVELVIGQPFTDDGVVIDSTYYGSSLTGGSTSGDIVDIDTVGTYIIRYDYTDANGLIATQRTRTVNVVAIAPTATPVPSPTPTPSPSATASPTATPAPSPTPSPTPTATTNVTPPVITLTSPNPQQLSLGDSYTELGATAIDNTSTDISANIVIDTTDVNMSAVGSYNVTYNVTDSIGNEATEVIRTVGVSDNSMPVAVSQNLVVAWGQSIAITLVANDTVDSSANLTYAIVSNPTKGTINAINGQAVTYTHVPVSPFGNDSFTFTATDANNNTSLVGTITIAPINAIPVITNPGTISLDQNESKTFDIIIEDTDSTSIINLITNTSVSNGTLSETASSHTGTTTTYTYTYVPNLGYSGSDSWAIIGQDAREAQSSEVIVQFQIAYSPTFVMSIGTFGTDIETLCVAPTPNLAYGDTSQANSVSDLNIGDTIYWNSALTQKVAATGQLVSYIPVSDSFVTVVIGVDASGNIVSKSSCTTSTSASRDVKYAVNEVTYCEGVVQTVTLWFDQGVGGINTNKTLNNLASEDIPVFISEYYSNLYTSQFSNATNANEEANVRANAQGTIDSGIYSEISSSTLYFKRSTLGAWAASSANVYTYECAVEVPRTTQYLNVFQSSISDPDINEFCASNVSAVTLYYTLPSNETGYANLLELASAPETPIIYKSIIGAEGEDLTDLFESNIFSTSNGYLIWDNQGDGINLNWYGYDSQTHLVSGNDITHTGLCSQYNKPDITVTNELSSNSSVNATNVFYGFMSCKPEIEGPTNGTDESLFWPIYIIDGLHTNKSGDTGSYIETYLLDKAYGDIVKTDNFESCLEYSFKIIAEDVDDAISLLNDQPLLTSQRPVVSSGIELGFGSETNVNFYNSVEECVTGSVAQSTYTFPILTGYETSKIGPNFNTQSNYELDNVSKPLLRTNPKLSGNIKIVTGSDGSIYLESISATKELADIKYKKRIINPNGIYASDMSNFFKANGTPSDLVYLTKRTESDLSVLDSYNKQIEEEYQYGTTYNESKTYTESYRMFAPLWIDVNVPKRFVIFKVNDPIGLDSTSVDFSTMDRMQEILKKSEIIKTFDLTKDSGLGTYIRSHVQQEVFPKSPITVSFERNGTTSYNGIDLKSGELTSKGEYMYRDFVQADKPIIEANDFITDGFKRNDIICANLLNLEFLFDDDSSADYSVNRYFGLYVDDIDSGTGEINSIDNNVITFSEINSIVDPDNPTTAIPTNKQMITSPTLGYVSIDELFYKISNHGFYDSKKSEVKISDSTGTIPGTIGIRHNGNSVNLTQNEDRGYDFVKMSIIDIPETNDKLAVVSSREESYEFTFIKHAANENIIINIEEPGQNSQLSFFTGANFAITKDNIKAAWINLYGTSDTYLELIINEAKESFVINEILTNLGDLNINITGSVNNIIRVDQLQTNVNLQNRTYLAKYDLPKGTYNGRFFSNQGTTGDIASAVASVINGDDSELDAYNIGSDIWVKTRVPGYRLLQHVVMVSKSNVVDFIKVYNEDINNLLKLSPGINSVLYNWRAHYLNGGNSNAKSIFIDNTTISEISIGDYLETQYKDVYNKVIDIVEDITIPNSGRSKLILDLKAGLIEGETRVFNKNVVSIGLFSAYDIYDMNFDFYDTSNSELKELDLETRANMSYEPYENALSLFDNVTEQFTTTLEANDIFSDDYSIAPLNYFSNLSGILSEESIEEASSDIITSEFDRLKENELKEFAINSRVVPNINKWVLLDSLTVREQPYYLNTNEAFGRTNFSPDLQATGRNKNEMTHEWFYMDKKPKYLRYDELNSTFSYVNFIEGFELTPDVFKSTKYDYFDKFMITEGFEKNLSEADLDKIFEDFGEYTDDYLNREDINNTFFKTNLQKKYTTIGGGNDDAFASTIFKGLKVVLKNRKEYTNSTALDFVKSSEFNGYKFSILLRTNTDTDTNKIDFEVIQNKKFKFVIFFIDLNISDYWINGNMNRKLLYELDHKIIYDHVASDYLYANTLFDGGLNWNGTGIESFHGFDGTGPFDIEGITHFDGSEPSFDDQILLGENGLYGDVLMDLYPNTPGNELYKFSIYSVEDSNSIIVNGPPVKVSDPTVELDVLFLPNYIQRNIKYYYLGGGTNIHKSLLEKLSINNVADMLRLNNDSVTYTTIEEDGTSNNSRFTINFEDGTEIIKYATLSIEEDNDKPKSYKLSKGIIGQNLVESDDPEYYPFLIRHNGEYTVDFKPVITFTDMYTHFKSNRLQGTGDERESGLESKLYKHSLSVGYEIETAKSYYERYNRCGTTFNVGFILDGGIHDLNWGIIKNHFYHKVNETNPTGVTKLSKSSDKLPLYPLINEIAISKKDINVFRSSWDKGYYTRSLSGGNTEEVPGTVENAEEKSYFASTTMKIKEAYDLTSFTYTLVDSQEALDKILKNSINESEVILFENKTSIIADFYISDIATRLLRNDGVLDAISKYVSSQDSAGDKTTLADDANFYINKNIISQFSVDSILLYTKKFKGSASSIVNTDDVSSIGAGGFSPDNNFAYKSHKQKPMNFRLIYNKRLGYSYDIKPMIKIKS